MTSGSHKNLGQGCKLDAFIIAGLLKGCANKKDLGDGVKLHACIQKDKYLEKNIFIASSLVSMYARCGALAKARQVLQELPARNVVTWNALIAGYAQQGQGEEALKLFENMQCDGNSPDAFTFSVVLKVCGSLRAVARGEQIHNKLVSLGMLEKNIILGNTLVDMYAKCGALTKARQVLEEHPIRSVIMWNALIAGYAQHQQEEEALNCFDSMQCDGHSPNAITFISVLKTCGSIGASAKGEKIHEKIVSLGLLENNIVLGNTLVDMYARCGVLAKAEKALQELPVRNIVTWTALMAGYVQQGQGEEALECLDRIQYDGETPNAVTFICALKACGRTRAAAKGKQIHDQIISLGLLEKDTVLGNTLVDMYAKCGALAKARKVLDGLPVHNVVAWTALVAGYVEQGEDEEALYCFDSMQHDDHAPDAVTFIYALKACGRIAATAKGKQIHDKIISLGMLDKTIELGNALVDMYARCGALFKAQQVLEELPIRDLVSWTVLIEGYAKQGQDEKALKCFNGMKMDGHSPDVVTFICALKACKDIGAAADGEQIHDNIVSLGMIEKSGAIGSGLVNMYARCGALAKAHQVFIELPLRDVVTWTVLIEGYAQQGQAEEALKCFDNMQCDGHFPDSVTFMCALKACGNIGAAIKGKEIHEKVVRLGMLEKNAVLGSALVDMYARCGALAKAQQVLTKFPVNVISWTALIAGYVEQGQGEEALKCFDIIQHDGHLLDSVTFTSALKACGSIGAAAKGEQIHEEIVRLGMLSKNISLGCTLVDMYARCGTFAKVQQLLTELSVQDVVSWTAVIAGYALQGQSAEALNCFERMESKGVKPDSTTLVCVLNACRHSGLLDKAVTCFSAMSTKYGILPDLEHYCCMVDVFGHAGNFKKALGVIVEMPSTEHLPVWASLLGACRNWGEVQFGRLAFEHALHLDKSHAAIYICMAYIYIAVDMQEDAKKTEVMRVANKAW